MAIYQGEKILSGGGNGKTPYQVAKENGFEGTEIEFNEFLANIDKSATKEDLTSHINDKNNPHEVTASQIGAAPSSHSHSMADITDLNIGGGGADILTATTSTSILGSTSSGSGYASFTSSYSSIPDVSISGSSFTVPAGYTKACIIAHADLIQEDIWQAPSIQIRKNGSSIGSYALVNCQLALKIPTTLSAACAVTSGDTISLYGSAPYGGSTQRTAVYFTGITILLFK